MAYEFRCKRRVEFAETDMAGIVHFSNFFRYMEFAEHEFLRSLGLSVHDPSREDFVAWPRVNAECTYDSPLKFNEEVEVHLLVREKRSKAITYEFRFYKAGTNDAIALGSITVVCVSVCATTGKMSAVHIPESINRLIDQAPKELFAYEEPDDAGSVAPAEHDDEPSFLQ